VLESFLQIREYRDFHDFFFVVVRSLAKPFFRLS